MRLIGLTGRKQSGKTTAGNILQHVHGFEHVSFAGPMRNMMCDMLGVTLDQLEEIKEDPILWLGGSAPRQMMQSLGTEWGRNVIHRDLWLLCAMRKAGALLKAGKRVVISDVRFDNEAEAIIRAGGVIYRVERPRTGRQVYDDHISERGIDQRLVGGTIHNDGSEAALAEEVGHLLLSIQ